MSLIKADQDFSIVIRKSACREKRIELQVLKAVMLKNTLLGENQNLLSFGPHFGIEAAEDLSNALTRLGLEFWDDYFVFYGDIPYWIEFWIDEKVIK